MTLGEGKRKVYMLLDEYSSGGALTRDSDIEARMADFFDMAQKQVAGIKRIRRSKSLELREGQSFYPLPPDLMKLIRIWQGGKALRRSRIKGGCVEILAGPGENVEIEYFALPASIGPDTPDDYEFELSDDAAAALPFFVASQQLAADLVMDYGAMFKIYQSMLSTLTETEGGSAELVNSLYRR